MTQHKRVLYVCMVVLTTFALAFIMASCGSHAASSGDAAQHGAEIVESVDPA